MPSPPRSPKIGAAVRALRIGAGLTQADLAAAVEIAPETLSRIETNRATGVSMALSRRIASALGVPLAELLKEPLEPNRTDLRPAERALLALVHPLDEHEVRDVVKLLSLSLRLGRRRSRGAAQRKGR